jgi:hypothetical protein
VNNPAPTASSAFGSIDPKGVDGAQALRTGLDLARASQLTMLRLLLALHRSNRRTAMQALDNLLDIDAEMEGLAARLDGAPVEAADDAALSDFIGLQKAALAAEKHGLAGGDLRKEADAIILPAPPPPSAETDVPAPPPLPDDAVEDDDPPRRRRWIYGLAAAILVVLIGIGVTAYLRPGLFVTMEGIGIFG